MFRSNRKWAKLHVEKLTELKWLEVTGDYGKLHSEELIDLK
jgi:hypothetical protein